MFEVDGIYFKQKFNYLVVAGVSEKIKSDIVIPNEINGFPIKEIAAYAFQNVNELDSISFTGEIEVIGEKAFYHCKNLKMVCFLSDTSHPVKVKELAFAYCDNLIVVSGDVHLLLDGEYIFHNCKAMTKMPSQIMGTIPIGTFSGCKSLKILIFYNVENVCTAAFLDCKNIEKMFILQDFTYSSDFLDGLDDVKILCKPESSFSNLAYEGFHVTPLNAIKQFHT